MCGRFSLISPFEILKSIFRLNRTMEINPHYNIAPSENVLSVRQNAETGERELVPLRWGLIPFWAKEMKIGNRLINAQAETVFEKPAFRHAAKKQRCLIPADGFFEWRKSGAKKQPYRILNKDRTPLAFAGLWEKWKNPEDGNTVESCTILTTQANALVDTIHDRMPVILQPEEYDLWLDPEVQDKDNLSKLLNPYPAELMETYPVNSWMSNARNEGPQCLEPVAEQTELDF